MNGILPAVDDVHPQTVSNRGERLGPVVCHERILVIAAVDLMVWNLLLPWIRALRDRGFQVHIACAATGYIEHIRQQGFEMHVVNLRRNFNLFAHVRATWEIVRLIRSVGFHIVNTHSPIGAAVGRLAALIGRVDTIIYTVHGFYFHDRMPRLRRLLFTGIEWVLGRCTDGFMFVSDEDARTARRLGIAGAKARTCTIYNGVDLDAFRPRCAGDAAVKELRDRHGLAGKIVIGTVGRVVREKGYREFLQMAVRLTREKVDAKYLVVGDSLPSDRDQFGPRFRKLVADAGLSDRFVFTGMTGRVADYLAVMDIFVLASYREGFPRSVLEAMATAVPVVTTDIRGCREAVQNGVSGYVVPPADAEALAASIRRLVHNPGERLEMGRRARARACALYDYRQVQERFGSFVAAWQ
jgi:glycosyltransferase involved in cell wall biosynthesis